MNIKLKILSIITATIFFLTIVILLKKRHLKEKYALYWISVGTIIVIIGGFFFYVLGPISQLFGIEQLNSTLFFFSIIFIIFSFLMLSIDESDLSTKVKNLIQEVSILKEEIKKMQNKRTKK